MLFASRHCKANSIVGPRLNELLSQELWQESYDDLEARDRGPQLSDADRFVESISFMLTRPDPGAVELQVPAIN